MLTGSMILYNGTGRLRNVAVGPNGGGNGYTPTQTGVLSSANSLPVNFCNGLPYNAAAQVCIAESPVAYFHQGMPFTSLDKIACDSAGAIAFYLAGIPRTAAGAIAISTAVGP